MAEVNPLAEAIANLLRDAKVLTYNGKKKVAQVAALIAPLLPDIDSAVKAEREEWQNFGIIGLAVRNTNVASYVEHWEGRALKAEQSLQREREECAKARALLREAEEALMATMGWAVSNKKLLVDEFRKVESVLSRIRSTKSAPSSPEPPSPVPVPAEKAEEKIEEGVIPMKKLEEMSGEELLDRIMCTCSPYAQIRLEDRGAFRAELLRRLNGDQWKARALSVPSASSRPEARERQKESQ